MTLDFSDDFDIYDNPETVAFYSRLADDTFATTPVQVTALRFVADKDLSPIARGHVATFATTFYLKAGELGNVRAKMGDKLVASGTETWFITGRVEYVPIIDQWDCPCELARG